MANNYTIGRGRLYFDRFDAAGASTGLRYLGNTPALGVAKNVQTVDHYDSDRGLKKKDRSVTLQEDLTLTFDTDNISVANLALWFGGAESALAAAPAAAAQTTALTNVVVGVAYPLGHENVTVTGVTVTAGGAAVDPANYEVDEAGGLITFTGGITSGTDDVTVAYDARARPAGGVILDSSRPITGALRYVADNPVGDNANMRFPFVKLTPNGNFDVKSDTWQKLSFTAEVLQAPDSDTRYRIEQAIGAAAVAAA